MNDLYISDYERFTPNKYNYWDSLLRRIRNHELNYIYLGRKNQFAEGYLVRFITSAQLRRYRRKYGLELNFNNIGGGIRLIHPWCITMNHHAIIGKDVTLYKGVTIGEIEKGMKAGNPTIEDNVTVYANATICGKITVGAGTIISAGAFVNFNVPPNSIVIGNPGIIK